MVILSIKYEKRNFAGDLTLAKLRLTNRHSIYVHLGTVTKCGITWGKHQSRYALDNITLFGHVSTSSLAVKDSSLHLFNYLGYLLGVQDIFPPKTWEQHERHYNTMVIYQGREISSLMVHLGR